MVVFFGSCCCHTHREHLSRARPNPQNTQKIYEKRYEQIIRVFRNVLLLLLPCDVGGKIECARVSNFPSSQIFIIKFITPHLLIILGTYIIHMILDTSRERISATHPEFYVKVIYFQFSLFIKPCSDTLRIYYPPSFFSVHNKYFSFCSPSLF